jgi:hypothetical protein
MLALPMTTAIQDGAPIKQYYVPIKALPAPVAAFLIPTQPTTTAAAAQEAAQEAAVAVAAEESQNVAAAVCDFSVLLCSVLRCSVLFFSIFFFFFFLSLVFFYVLSCSLLFYFFYSGFLFPLSLLRFFSSGWYFTTGHGGCPPTATRIYHHPQPRPTHCQLTHVSRFFRRLVALARRLVGPTPY